MGSVSRAAGAVSDVAIAALSCAPGEDVVGPVLQAFQAAVGADVAGYYAHQWTGWTTALAITPAAYWLRIPNAHLPTREAAAVHPGIRLCVAHPYGLPPFTLTDLISEREWLASKMGVLMRPDWGRNYQMAVPVEPSSGATETRVWVLGRATRDFTPGDRDAARALAAVLGTVSRHAHNRQLHPLPDHRSETPLTERELIVLQLLQDGLTAPGAAARLGISPRTVHKHTERIYRKFGTHNLHTALQAATELAILQPVQPPQADRE